MEGMGDRNRAGGHGAPCRQVITKKIIVPAAQKEEELELAVEAEANQYIPFALDEVNLDFQVLAPAPNNAEKSKSLSPRHARKRSRTGSPVPESAGLKPIGHGRRIVRDAGGVSPHRPSLPANGRDQNVALVDVGAHVTHFYVLRNNQFLFSPIRFLAAISLPRTFSGVQPVARGSRVREAKPGPARELRERRAQPFMETLALEITRALQFFFTSTSHSQVDQIVLSGGVRSLPGLDDSVAKRAGVATVVGQPVSPIWPPPTASGRANWRRTRRCC